MTARRSPAELQNAVLAFVKMYTRIEGRSPSLREIANGVGIYDKSGASKVVERLKSRGLIERRGPRVKGGRVGGLRLIGSPT